MQTEKRKVTYWGGYREIEGRFEFYLDDFYCEECVCPFCIKALAQYKHYNVVLNEDYLLGPDVIFGILLSMIYPVFGYGKAILGEAG